MNLTDDEQSQLWLVCWLGPDMSERSRKPAVLASLAEKKLIEPTQGGYQRTELGYSLLTPDAKASCRRPKDYAHFSGEGQWEIDARLGILDWDGKLV